MTGPLHPICCYEKIKVVHYSSCHARRSTGAACYKAKSCACFRHRCHHLCCSQRAIVRSIVIQVLRSSDRVTRNGSPWKGLSFNHNNSTLISSRGPLYPRLRLLPVLRRVILQPSEQAQYFSDAGYETRVFYA